MVIYLFSGWFISSFVLTFVILVILLAADFWTVKVRLHAGERLRLIIPPTAFPQPSLLCDYISIF